MKFIITVYLIRFNITDDTKEIAKFKDEMREHFQVCGTIGRIVNEASRKRRFVSDARNRRVGVRGRQGQVIGCLTLGRNRVRNRLHFW